MSVSPSIAFLLLTHRPTPMLERLLGALDRFEGSEVFWHHDGSQAALPDDLRKRAQTHFIEPYLKTGWGTTNITEAEWLLLNAAHQRSRCEWFVLLSAACYPLKSATQIMSFLGSTEFDGFIERNPSDPRQSSGLPYWWHRKAYTKHLFHVPFVSRKLRFYQREIRVPDTKSPYLRRPLHFGSQFFILRRKALDALISEAAAVRDLFNHSHRYERQMGKGFASDECVFHTILQQRAGLTLSQDSLRFIDWTDAKDWHPNTLTEEHIPAIEASQALFGRKFDIHESAKILNHIDSTSLKP